MKEKPRIGGWRSGWARDRDEDASSPEPRRLRLSRSGGVSLSDSATSRRLSGRQVTARIGTVVSTTGVPPSDETRTSRPRFCVAIHLPSGDHTGRVNVITPCITTTRSVVPTRVFDQDRLTGVVEHNASHSPSETRRRIAPGPVRPLSGRQANWCSAAHRRHHTSHSLARLVVRKRSAVG